MPARPAVPAQHVNQPGNVQGQPGAQNEGGNARNGGDEAPPAGATEQEMRDYIARLQLENTNKKHRLDEVIRQRDQLQTSQQNRRRCARYVDQPTPDDPKYDKVGKRCTLMHLLWIPSDLFETEPDATYTEDRRYEAEQPGTQTQGDLPDVLASAPLLREGLLHQAHFQSMFINSGNEQRRNSAVRARKTSGSLIFGCKQEDLNDDMARRDNPEFQRLLGYQADRCIGRRYRALPPLFYGDELSHSNEQLFRHKILLRLFRACAFGPSSVPATGTAPADPRGQPVLAKKLALKSITPGAIAFSATLARWCLSPDKEFSEKGKISAIEYKKDYGYYKKIIIEGLRAEKEPFARNAIQRPFMRLINEWNKEFFSRQPHANEGGHNEDDSAPSDIDDAMEQIERFGQGEE
ncbi:hypothetical protein FRC06_003414 [Ceratobasidium sp. 370]|nr:hypothetical protein FRC06_003414 [Ceratobasidium sp. 370]